MPQSEDLRKLSPGHAAYYIDPVSGNDGNSGLAPDLAWRTFRQINALRLAAGDRVEITAPGSFNETLSLTGDGTPEEPVEVCFAAGRYDFFPEDSSRRQYYISNASDDAANGKAIGILLDGAHDFVLSGPGARIVCRGKMIEVCIDSSENIAIADLQFDYHRPTVSEFTVTAAAPDYADLAIHRDSAYRVEDGHVVWVGEGWSYETGLAQELISETDEVWRRKDPLSGLAIEETGPFMIRAKGAHDMVAGRVFQIRNTFRDCVGVFMRRSSCIIMKNVDLLFMHGMGVLCQFCEDITLDHVSIAPEKNSGRTTAAWADCTHFSGCRGIILIRNCIFCGAHDDAVNIHGTHLRIVRQISERQIVVRFMHRQTYGFMAFNPGDDVEFVRWDSLAPFGVNRVAAVEMIDPRELLLTLAGPSPDWHENDVLENVTWTPTVEISGCRAMRIPTRGFLLTTRRPVVVNDNTFIRLGNGIHIESDAEGWFESGCVRDMEIRGNRFVQSKKEAIHISPHNSVPNDSVHRNVRIHDNEFVGGASPCVVASGTNGLTVAGNTVYSEDTRDDGATVLTSGCAEVAVERNRYLAISEWIGRDLRE